MDVNHLKTLGFALAAMMVAGAVVRKYRHFFEWQEGDDWAQFIRRALSEQGKDAQAQLSMFGSPRATAGAYLVNLIGLLGFMCSARIPVLMLLIWIYLLIGVWVSRHTAADAQTAEHGRLSISDRFWFRLFFAWSWPFYGWFRNRPKG